MTSKTTMITVSVVVSLGIASIALWKASGGKSPSSLAADLQSADAHVRHDASRKLAKLGPAAKDAIPALAEALKDSDKRVRFHAAKALSEIGIDAKVVAAALIDSLNEPDLETRYYIIKSLSKIDLGPEHMSAVPGLTQALKDENPKTLYYASKCLKSIGPGAKDALPALRAVTSNGDQDAREAATSALKRISRTN